MLEPAVSALLGGGVGSGAWIDATFGGGGHSGEILRRLPPDACLLALDCDDYAAMQAATVADPRFIFARRNFADIKEAAEAAGVTQVHGVLFDLGVSSMQLDAAERGLSFRCRGPLDMRLDRRAEMTAGKLLAVLDEQSLAQLFRRYGEEPEARRVARALWARRDEIVDTATLARLVVASKRRHPPGRHSATLVFQALRIAVNDELENLRRGLAAACDLLSAGGRLVVIAFHSLEDRIVKRLMTGISFPGFGRINALGMRALGRAHPPSAEEVAANPRARSARMRVFVKMETV